MSRKNSKPRLHTPSRHPREMSNDELWDQYKHWVEKIARFYASLFRVSVSSFEILMGAGFEGLERATKTWDPAGGAGFMSYSHRSIANHIKRAAQSEVIGKPYRIMGVYKLPLVLGVGNFDQAFEYKDLDEVTNKATEQRFIKFRKIDGWRDRRAEADASGHSHSPEDMVVGKGDMLRVYAKLKCLNARERKILVAYYNLEGKGELTLDDIGKPLGITRERVRQIAAVAMYKLKKELGVPAEEPKCMAHARIQSAKWRAAAAAAKQQKRASAREMLAGKRKKRAEVA